MAVSEGYQYCTGTVHTWVGLLSSSSAIGYQENLNNINTNDAIYLGSCEQYPVVRNIINWNPWYADDTGPMEPADYEAQGESKIIVLDLNKYSEYNVSLLTSSARTITRGKLLQANTFYFRMWLVFSNFDLKDIGMPVGDDALPVGELYFCCRLLESNYTQLGNRSRTTQLVIAAKPIVQILPNAQVQTTLLSTDPNYFIGLA